MDGCAQVRASVCVCPFFTCECICACVTDLLKVTVTCFHIPASAFLSLGFGGAKECEQIRRICNSSPASVAAILSTNRVKLARISALGDGNLRCTPTMVVAAMLLFKRPAEAEAFHAEVSETRRTQDYQPCLTHRSRRSPTT